MYVHVYLLLSVCVSLIRFSPISHDNKALMKGVHQCNMRMLRVYGTELDWLKHHYEEHKVHNTTSTFTLYIVVLHCR